jgi:hypothetical protein
MRQLTHRRPQCSFAWEKQLPNRRGDPSHTTRHTHLHIATQHQPWHAHSHSGCLFIKTRLGVSRSSPLTRGWRRAPPLRSSQSHPTRCPAPQPRSPSRPKTQFLMPLQKGGQRRSIRYCRFCLGNVGLKRQAWPNRVLSVWALPPALHHRCGGTTAFHHPRSGAD